MTNGVGPDQQGVFVIMLRSEVEYVREHMITDAMRLNVRNVGVSTVMRSLLQAAIAAHRKQATVQKVAACNSNRTRLMAGK